MILATRSPAQLRATFDEYIKVRYYVVIIDMLFLVKQLDYTNQRACKMLLIPRTALTDTVCVLKMKFSCSTRLSFHGAYFNSNSKYVRSQKMTISTLF